MNQMPNTISLPMGPMPMGVNAATMAAAAYTATRYTTPKTMHSIATKMISWSFQPPLAAPFSFAIPCSPLVVARGTSPLAISLLASPVGVGPHEPVPFGPTRRWGC